MSADGLRLYYRDYPAEAPGRTPVLCLPGLTRNSRDFESIALRIRRSRRVLCADLRGRGLSQHDPNWKNYHPGTYVGDVAVLLKDAGVSKVIILGTSLGGILAMVVAATTPQVLAGVILNDVGPEVAAEGLKRISTYVGKSAPVSSWAEAAAAGAQHLRTRLAGCDGRGLARFRKAQLHGGGRRAAPGDGSDDRRGRARGSRRCGA